MSSLSRAVKGATKSKDDVSKDKYLDLIQAHLSDNADISDFLALLKPRLYDDYQSTSFSHISFKAHVLLHKKILSTIVSPRYKLWDAMISYQNDNKVTLLPPLDHKLAHSSSDYRLLSAYNRYISQRVGDFNKLQLDPIVEKHKGSSVVDNANSANISLTSSGLLDQAQSVIIQLRLILDCLFTKEMFDSPLYLQCYDLLARDATTLFRFLNLAIVLALQSFFSLARPDAERTLFIYKEFTQLQISDDVKAFVAQAPNSTSSEDLKIPSALQQTPKSITELTKALESYLFSSSQSNTRPSSKSSSSHATTPSIADSIPETVASSVYSTSPKIEEQEFNPTPKLEQQPFSHQSYTSLSPVSSAETRFGSNYTYKNRSTSSESPSLDVTRTPSSSTNGLSPVTPPSGSTTTIQRTLTIKGDNNNNPSNDWNDIFDSLIQSDAPSLDLDTSRISLHTKRSLESDIKPLPPPPSTLREAHSTLQLKTKNIFKALRKSN